MKFEDTISMSDLISIAALVLAFIGIKFSLCQWRESTLIKRAAYINDIIEKTRTDIDIQEIARLFDY